MRVIEMPQHEHKCGDIVYVLNNAANGDVIVEGKAKIERYLTEDHLYAVRFIQEPDATYERFVRPGDQRTAWKIHPSTASDAR